MPVSRVWFAFIVLLYLFTIALGSYLIELNFFTFSWCRGDNSRPLISITFDDGPNSGTAEILDILKKENVPATFFCIGANIKGNESIIQKISSEGHLIGTHSFHHLWSFPLQASNKIAGEIKESQELVFGLIGKKPLLFRPPFGVTDPPIANAIKKTGVRSIGWSVRSYDTVISSPDKLLKRIRHIKNGDIILFHDKGLQTNVILAGFIKNIRAQGFEIIPLHELLGIQAYEI